MSEVKFTDARSFQIALADVADRVPADLMSLVQRKLLLGALSGVVERTPVDTGRARGNWQVTQDSPSTSVIESFDRSGSQSQAVATAAIGRLSPFARAFISNNLPYIGVLEYGGYPPPSEGPKRTRAFKFVTKDGKRRKVNLTAKTRARESALAGPKVTAQGFSIQAPNGMVRITFEDMRIAAQQLAAGSFGSFDRGGVR